MISRRTLLLALVVLGFSRPPAATAQTVPIIAAAADLKFALEEIAAKFALETKKALRLNFGSSGNFTTQLLQGAPFELFLSADEGFVFQLDRKSTRLNSSHLVISYAVFCL